MLIWQGLGFLVVLIVFLTMLLVDTLFSKITGETFLFGEHLTYLSLFISAVLVFFLSRKLDKIPGRKLIDSVTGQEFLYKRQDTLFFIPIKYWSLILVAIGVFNLAKTF